MLGLSGFCEPRPSQVTENRLSLHEELVESRSVRMHETRGRERRRKRERRKRRKRDEGRGGKREPSTRGTGGTQTEIEGTLEKQPSERHRERTGPKEGQPWERVRRTRDF